MSAVSEKDEKVVLPPIPAKQYFTISEVSELCDVKLHVLRYWEQEFTQLKSVKRRSNRRYYQHHEVLLIRRIRKLLYEEGFTVHGARNRLDMREPPADEHTNDAQETASAGVQQASPAASTFAMVNVDQLRQDLLDVFDALNAKAR